MANSCNKLMKEAIDVAVNEFRGIEFTYKLDDVLDSLSPNQKFSSNQLKGYLLKQGVSPNEIRASKMFEGFENDNRALNASEWKSMSGKQKFDAELTHEYDGITLGKKGESNDTYRAKLFTSYPRELSTNTSHFSTQAYANPETGNPENSVQKSILGWNRVHQDEINGKPTTVLNELQSDWMQAERQGAGTFESNVKAEKESYYKLRDRIEEARFGSNVENLTTEQVNKLEEELKNSRLYREGSKREIADFPMKPEKFQQLMIVDALNEAWENGNKRVAIPIERDNELYGSTGVTKFYESLNKSILPDIRKKLEKQGLRVKVSMEDYGSSGLKPNKNGGDLGLLKEKHIRDNLDISHLSDAELHDALRNIVKDIRNSLLSSRLSRSSLEALENKGVDVEGELFHKLLTGKYLTPYARNLPSFAVDFFNSRSSKNNELSSFLKAHIPGTPANRLHILEIEEVPNARVKWDVYGLLASLGLGGLASQSEAAEPISTTSGIAPRETNSMMETMRLEGQPNIFRLQDLATGRTRVSKAKPKEKEILDYFSQKESKGDYNAKSSISSAYGKYQFLKDTLAEKARLHGMTVKEARTPQGQEELMRKVLKDYEARLRKFDLPITKENLFVVHNLGETGGIRAIRGTYTPEDVERMRNNIPGTKVERNSLSKSEVVKEYYKMHKVTKGS